jgi:hypothetical protein
MRQRLGKIADFIGIKIFISIAGMAREGKVPLKNGRIQADLKSILPALPSGGWTDFT